MKINSLISLLFLIPALALAQQPNQRTVDSLRAVRAAQSAAAYKKYQERVFTHADTLRGSITPERAWWNVLRYDITVKPDFVKKATSGKNLITYKVVQADYKPVMQIDLQAPL